MKGEEIKISEMEAKEEEKLFEGETMREWIYIRLAFGESADWRGRKKADEHREIG
jgi:hypothetical protein